MFRGWLRCGFQADFAGGFHWGWNGRFTEIWFEVSGLFQQIDKFILQKTGWVFFVGRFEGANLL